MLSCPEELWEAQENGWQTLVGEEMLVKPNYVVMVN